MKLTILPLILIGLINCSGLKELNEKIYASQKAHLNSSPYKEHERERMQGEISIQKEHRTNLLEGMQKGFPRLVQGNDTLVLIESYDEICANCLSYEFWIVKKDTVYSYDRDFINGKEARKYGQVHLNLQSQDWNYTQRRVVFRIL